MKKLLLLFVGLTLWSCSSDSDGDSTTTPDQQVTAKSYTVFETTNAGSRMTFTATVKNNTNVPVMGNVSFEVPKGQVLLYDYIYDVTLQPNETKTVTGIGSIYFDSETITIAKAEFEPNE